MNYKPGQVLLVGLLIGQLRKKMDVVLWWKSLFLSHTELIQLAKWALSILPTIGAAERNWLAFSYIHSKNRNSLLNDTVNKLVYIY